MSWSIDGAWKKVGGMKEEGFLGRRGAWKIVGGMREEGLFG